MDDYETARYKLAREMMALVVADQLKDAGGYIRLAKKNGLSVEETCADIAVSCADALLRKLGIVP